MKHVDESQFVEVLTSTDGQAGLPRYFAQVFKAASEMQKGQIDFVLPDGRVFRATGKQQGPEAVLNVHNPDVFARLIREGDLGFCEAYVEQWWSSPDLQTFLDLVHADNDELYDGYPGMGLVRAYEKLRFWLQRNSKRGSKKNIAHHYDLGNDFYGLWLDKTMTYSSALFETGTETTEEAQIAKYAALVDRMGVRPGDHVLEIGCGWGGFAEYAAAERGLRVTCLTISKEQFDYAEARIKAAGLSDKVTFKLQDYRDETGVYDGIASIEMFEAVGEKYWPVYFGTLKKCLKPGRSAALQIITVQHRRWEVYRNGVDFIQKYIFPGGMLPSPVILREEIAKAGLLDGGSQEFGESYSITLRRWYKDFNEQWPQIARQGFDTRFQRMWNFYLTACAATFHFGNCDVTQITVTKPS
ncbi:SAM-dependent methyltransferase [Pacificoceanicola onchidii]|uniref:SAM-dependent methyltransferase n=1 Tax=Pacificoceanicola onchidii TaxID=2562685 RepID=UPI0010A464B5|nr:cyclopropane-fatty-acyl-phospholipid synthase family protein [Pacificoceanicola onchidii]